jgi:ankyrin repeat protein
MNKNLIKVMIMVSIIMLIATIDQVNADEEFTDYRLFFQTAERGHVRRLKECLAQGARADYRRSPDDMTALHILADSKFHPCKQTVESGETFDCVETARILIENGADVNAVSIAHMTPLLYALIDEHYELAEFLIESGADVNIKEASGVTVLGVSIVTMNKEMYKIIIPKCDVETVNLFIGEHTPLHRAVIEQDLELVKLLIDQGADPTIRSRPRTPPGATAYDYALIKFFNDAIDLPPEEREKLTSKKILDVIKKRVDELRAN